MNIYKNLNCISKTIRFFSNLNKVKLTALYDGECPLCEKEISFLKKRDPNSSIEWIDVSSSTQNPNDHKNISYEDSMKSMHVQDSDGNVYKGISSFNKMYEQVGLGWVFAITKIPALKPFFDRVQDFWAKHRMRISGRPPLEEVFEKQKLKMEEYNSKL